MASDPNNDAEKLLRDYAQERRLEAAPELHPATRRLLQGEAARVYGGGRAGAELPWWRKVLVSPQVGWALGVVFVAGISFMALRQPKQKFEPVAEPATVVQPAKKAEGAVQLQDELAKDVAPKAAPTVTAPSGGMTPPVRAKALPELKTPESPREIPQEHENVVVAPSSPPPVVAQAAPTVAPASASSKAQADVTQDLRRQQSAVAQGERAESAMKTVQPTRAFATADKPAAASTSNEFVLLNTLATRSLANNNNDGGFSNFGAANNRASFETASARAQSAGVLSQFTMRQVGRSVIFKELDGSSYTGGVVTLPQGTNVFRATGTNLTLQLAVVFTGQMSRAVAPAQMRQQVRGQQVPLADQALRVQGQATIGRTNQIQVDAQTVAPTR